MSQKIAIVGASGHGRVVLDVLEKQGQYEVVGFADARRPVGESEMGVPILGNEDALLALARAGEIDGYIVAIGDNAVRAQVVERIRGEAPELALVSAVHPGAEVGRDVTIGAGTVVMAGVCINPCARIGDGCILNTRSSLDHDSTMGDFSSLAPGVTTGGNCTIGEGAAVGVGATLIHGVSIGEHTVIGAGATVVGSVAPYQVAYGSPAKVIRSRSRGDRYL